MDKHLLYPYNIISNKKEGATYTCNNGESQKHYAEQKKSETQ